MATSFTKYRPDVDGLRAIAIVSVVIFHAFPFVMPNGFVGVDIFFVISGYLIGGMILSELDEGKFSFLEFYKRRIKRLLPALAVVYVATVVIGAVLLAPGDFNTLTYTLRASVLLGSNLAFAARTGYFDPAASVSPLIHTWSLSVEEQFYLVIPLLLWLVGPKSARILGAILLGLAAISVAFAIHGAFEYPAKSFFLPQSRAWELLVGVLLARFEPFAKLGAGGRSFLGVTGLAATGLSIWLPDELGPLHNLLHIALACLGGAALIETGRRGFSLSSRILAASPFVYVGLISYPLYLWHWPLLVYSHMLAGGQGDVFVNGAVVLAAFALADITRRFVEAPLRFRLRLSTRNIYLSFGAVTAILIGFSLVNEATKGLPARFSGPIRAVFAIENEWRGSQRLKCMSVTGTLAIDDRRAPENPCRMGADNAPVSVMLWGDSHAAAMQPGLSKWLKEHGLAGVAVTFNCHPIELRSAGEEGFADCSLAREQILDSFLKSETTTLFLAMRWNRQVEGAMPLERGYHPISDGSKAERARALSDQLAAIAAKVEDSGKRLVVIYTVPEMNFDVPDSMGIRMHLGLPMPQGPQLSEVQVERDRTVKAIENGLAKFDVKYVDPVTSFCEKYCTIETNGTPLYFDNNHLTIAAADIVLGMFDRQLNGAYSASIVGAGPGKL